MFPAFSFSHYPIKETLVLPTPFLCLPHSLRKTLLSNWFTCAYVAQDQKEKGERPRDQALVLFKKARTGDTNVQNGKWERG